MEKTILLGCPLHSMNVHGNDLLSFQMLECPIESLNGSYLHYTYLMALDTTDTVAVDFFPDGSPSTVRVGEIGNLKPYIPDVKNDKMIEVTAILMLTNYFFKYV